MNTLSVSIGALGLLLIGFGFNEEVLSAAPVPATEPGVATTPVIAFYKRQGESNLDCTIVMTEGLHKFKDNRCTNDDVYYFVIRNPRDGLHFTIHNDGNCNMSEAWAGYWVRDPDYGSNTEILSVQASYNLPEGKEIVRGVTASSYRDKGNLEGKVSCLNVRNGGG